MSYDSSALSLRADLIGGKYREFIYRSPDSLATVSASGYFADSYKAGVREGDTVFIVETDQDPPVVTQAIVSVIDANGNATVALAHSGLATVDASNILEQDSSYIPPTDGASRIPAYIKFRETLTPDEVAGRLSTGASDDDFIDYFDEAIDYFRGGVTLRRQQGGTVVAPNQYALSRTLLIQGLGVTVKGSGYGVSTRPSSGTLLRSFHSVSGNPVVRIKETFNAGLENLRIANGNANTPSAFLDFNETATGSFLNSNLRRIWLGLLSGFDDGDIGVSNADVGVLVSGTINGDSNVFEDVTIYGTNNYGVDVQNPNFSDTTWRGLFVYFSPVGFRINSATNSIHEAFFAHNTDCAFLLKGSAGLFVNGFGSEKGARLLKLDSASAGARFLIENGGFQIQDDTGSGGFHADARLVDTSTATLWLVNMKNFKLQYSSYTGAQPTLRIGNHSGGLSTGTLVLENTGDIQPAQIDAPTATGPNDLGLHIVYKPMTSVAQDTTFDGDLSRGWTESEDRSWETGRRDFRARVNIFGGPFKVKKLVEPVAASTWSASAVLGSGATTYSYKLVFKTKDGHTALSNAATCTNAASLDSTHTNRIAWYWPQGCISVDIYGRVAASEAFLKNVPWDSFHQIGSTIAITSGWIDDGSLTPSGAGPTTNTTGSAYVQGPLIVPNIPTADPHIVGQLWSNSGVVTVSAG